MEPDQDLQLKVACLEVEKRTLEQKVRDLEANDYALQGRLGQMELELEKDRNKFAHSSKQAKELIEQAEKQAEAVKRDNDSNLKRLERTYGGEEKKWNQKLDELQAKVHDKEDAYHQAATELHQIREEKKKLNHRPHTAQPEPSTTSQQALPPVTAIIGARMDGLRNDIARLQGELAAERSAYAKFKEDSRREIQSLKSKIPKEEMVGETQEKPKRKRKQRKSKRKAAASADNSDQESSLPPQALMEELGSEHQSVCGSEAGVPQPIAYATMATQTDSPAEYVSSFVQATIDPPEYVSSSVQATIDPPEYVSCSVQATMDPPATKGGRKISAKMAILVLFFLLTLATLIWSVHTQILATRERSMWQNANDVSRKAIIYITNMAGEGKRVGWLWEEKLMKLEVADAGFYEKRKWLGPEY